MISIRLYSFSWVFTALLADAAQERLLSEQTFDLAFLMAGTNDLASGEALEIAEAVRGLHAACHARRLRTVCLTVPPSQATTKWRDLEECRSEARGQEVAYMGPIRDP